MNRHCFDPDLPPLLNAAIVVLGQIDRLDETDSITQKEKIRQRTEQVTALIADLVCLDQHGRYMMYEACGNLETYGMRLAGRLRNCLRADRLLKEVVADLRLTKPSIDNLPHNIISIIGEIYSLNEDQ